MFPGGRAISPGHSTTPSDIQIIPGLMLCNIDWYRSVRVQGPWYQFFAENMGINNPIKHFRLWLGIALIINENTVDDFGH